MDEEAEKLLSAIHKDRKIDALRLYIVKNYDVCALQQQTQRTLLHAAASLIESVSAPEVAVMEVLVDKGVAVDARDQHGRTALMGCRTIMIAAFLLKRGADVHDKCNHQKTALHYAAQTANAAMVQILLEAGAAVAAVCKQGETPLGLACLRNNFEVSAYDVTL
jgi:Ankyrin repeats (many copies)